MHPDPYRSLAAAGLAVLILAGCGGDEERPQTAKPVAESPVPAAESSDRERPARHAARESTPGVNRPPDTRQVKPAPDGPARRLLTELAPQTGSPKPAPRSTDPASRELWQLVERATGGSPAGSAAAAPSPGALKRLLREAQRNAGG